MLSWGRYGKTLTHRRERREPLPSLDDYLEPSFDPTEFDDAFESRAGEAEDFELVWSDGFGWMPEPELGDFDEPIFDEAEDFDPPVYDYADDWADYT
jgi:hypothetical protein